MNYSKQFPCLRNNVSQLLGELPRSGGVVGGGPGGRVRGRGGGVPGGRHARGLHCAGPRYRLWEFEVSVLDRKCCLYVKNLNILSYF